MPEPSLGLRHQGQDDHARPEGDIVAEAGEAYYVGPGHTGEVGLPGTEVIEFSPADEYDKTMAVVAKNLEASGQEERFVPDEFANGRARARPLSLTRRAMASAVGGA